MLASFQIIRMNNTNDYRRVLKNEKESKRINLIINDHLYGWLY